MQAWLPPPLVNRARFAVLSGTVTMVPSTAQTSRPRHHVPRLPRRIAAGPRSRSNSHRSGAAPPAACLRQRPGRRRRHRKADQACGEPGPHPGISQPGKQAPGHGDALPADRPARAGWCHSEAGYRSPRSWSSR